MPSGMLQQAELTTSSPIDTPPAEAAPASANAGAAGEPPPQRIPRWLERLELFLRVALRIYVGLFICYAPWWPAFWDRNPLFAQFPTLSIYAANGAVRGIVSGLGLLNLWIALHEAVHHRNG